MIDETLTKFFSTLPDGAFLGFISFFVIWFVFISLLDIIEL